MKINIGSCTVGEDTVELESRFDKNIPHDWCGPQVKIKSITLDAEFSIGALGRSNQDDLLTIHPTVSVIAVITDEKDRTIEKRLTVDKLKERFEEKAYERGNFLVGWGANNPIHLNENGKALLAGVKVSNIYGVHFK